MLEDDWVVMQDDCLAELEANVVEDDAPAGTCIFFDFLLNPDLSSSRVLYLLCLLARLEFFLFLTRASCRVRSVRVRSFFDGSLRQYYVWLAQATLSEVRPHFSHLTSLKFSPLFSNSSPLIFIHLAHRTFLCNMAVF